MRDLHRLATARGALFRSAAGVADDRVARFGQVQITAGADSIGGLRRISLGADMTDQSVGVLKIAGGEVLDQACSGRPHQVGPFVVVPVPSLVGDRHNGGGDRGPDFSRLGHRPRPAFRPSTAACRAYCRQLVVLISNRAAPGGLVGECPSAPVELVPTFLGPIVPVREFVQRFELRFSWRPLTYAVDQLPQGCLAEVPSLLQLLFLV